MQPSVGHQKGLVENATLPNDTQTWPPLYTLHSLEAQPLPHIPIGQHRASNGEGRGFFPHCILGPVPGLTSLADLLHGLGKSWPRSLYNNHERSMPFAITLSTLLPPFVYEYFVTFSVCFVCSRNIVASPTFRIRAVRLPIR